MVSENDNTAREDLLQVAAEKQQYDPARDEGKPDRYTSDLRDEITITQETSRESKFSYTGVISTCVTISKLSLR